jgi:hypothetical protein
LTSKLVVPIGENVGFHDDRFPDDAFNCKLATIDFGSNALNYDTTSSVNRLFWHDLRTSSSRNSGGFGHSKIGSRAFAFSF